MQIFITDECFKRLKKSKKPELLPGGVTIQWKDGEEAKAEVRDGRSAGPGCYARVEP